MKPSRSFIPALFFLAGILLLPGRPEAAEADAPKHRILIVPFGIHAGENMLFLREGIHSMLKSRLEGNGSFLVVDPESAGKQGPPLEDSAALKRAAALSADLVVNGAVTALGGTVSTDARLIDVASGKALVVFSKIAQEQGETLQHIQLFADRIIQAVVQNSQPAEMPSTDAPPQPVKSSVYETTAGPSADIWKSQSIDGRIARMAVGDVNGDGKNEIVTASEYGVWVYRYQDGNMTPLENFGANRFYRIINLDAADINGNGTAEIFVTRVHVSRNFLQSDVYEWNGAAFADLVKKSSWYLHVLRPCGQEPILLGQKKGGDSDVFLAGTLNEMQWADGDYVPARRLGLPNWVNLFAFNRGNLFEDGRARILAFDPQDRFKVLNLEGDVEWTDKRKRGGNLIYLEYNGGSSDPDREYYYLPQRIHLTDLDHNGSCEAIVVQNNEVAKRMLARFRHYDEGWFECLAWDKIGFAEKWRTRPLSGYISDSALADADNDGKPELVFALGNKTGGFTGKEMSTLIIYELAAGM